MIIRLAILANGDYITSLYLEVSRTGRMRIPVLVRGHSLRDATGKGSYRPLRARNGENTGLEVLG